MSAPTTLVTIQSAKAFDAVQGTPEGKVVNLCADSVEKHEPASDIDTAVVDGLKALDPNRPIREADIDPSASDVR